MNPATRKFQLKPCSACSQGVLFDAVYVIKIVTLARNYLPHSLELACSVLQLALEGSVVLFKKKLDAGSTPTSEWVLIN